MINKKDRAEKPQVTLKYNISLKFDTLKYELTCSFMVTHRVSVKCCHRGSFAAALAGAQGARIISEGVEPPDGGRQVKGVDEGSRYVDVSHHYVLPGV